MDVFTVYRFIENKKERVDQKESILQAAARVEELITEDKAVGIEAGYSIEREAKTANG